MTHYVDRSRYECGMACPRKRYWNYHFGDRGLVPVGDAVDLAYGQAIHRATELVHHNHEFIQMKGMPHELDQEFTPDGYTRYREWESLYVGHTLTFKRLVLPKILQDYNWIASEVEGTLEIAPGIKWMYRLDGVLQRKSDGLYFLLETKTSSWPDKLIRQAPRNFQLMMELEALRAHYILPPESVGGALLLVFDKGQKRKVSEAEAKKGQEGYRRLSPFTYWYTRELASGEIDYSLEYRKGFVRRPVWGTAGWFKKGQELFPGVYEDQVTLCPSISFDPVHAKEVIRQVIRNEQLYTKLRGEIVLLPEYFVQNFSNCRNDSGYGKDCPYDALCFSPNAIRSPLEVGYAWRTPNHPQEPVPAKEEDLESGPEED